MMSVVWQRLVDPATPVWVRRRWEPRITAVAEQGRDRLTADRVSARCWKDLLAAGRHATTDGGGTGRGLLAEARHVGTRECAWQHRMTGPAETTAWSDWPAVTDDAVTKSPVPSARRSGPGPQPRRPHLPGTA